MFYGCDTVDDIHNDIWLKKGKEGGDSREYK